MLFHEGCVAIWARYYAWFLSDAQITELEDGFEEDVGSEEDSEEGSEEEVHNVLVCNCLATWDFCAGGTVAGYNRSQESFSVANGPQAIMSRS